MQKNGKTIKCKVCKKEIYISGSRIGVKKYCSRECGFADKWGFVPKKKKCIICGKSFVIDSQIRLNNKTCSKECWYENNKAISQKCHSERVTKICFLCKKEFSGLKLYTRGKYCKECQYIVAKDRIGKNNPNYKNGEYTHANFQGRKNKTAYKHLNECRRYKNEFIKTWGYQFCEVCSVNTNGTSRFEVHHIYFASRVPKHKNLHDNRNMIHICKECHLKFHNGDEYKSVFLKLEKERGLKELFGHTLGGK